MKLNRDFKEFIECLNESEARYLVIGGYAVAHHGRPRPDTIIQLGYEPHRIDLLTSARGLDFQDAWNECCTIQVEGVPIRILGLAHLLANKKAVGRIQDLADVEALEP